MTILLQKADKRAREGKGTIFFHDASHVRIPQENLKFRKPKPRSFVDLEDKDGDSGAVLSTLEACILTSSAETPPELTYHTPPMTVSPIGMPNDFASASKSPVDGDFNTWINEPVQSPEDKHFLKFPIPSDTILMPAAGPATDSGCASLEIAKGYL